MSTGTRDPQFLTENSSIKRWGWKRIDPYGDRIGRNVVTVGDGRDGDGFLVLNPNPRLLTP
jgi:hypothetical protein